MTNTKIKIVKDILRFSIPFVPRTRVNIIPVVDKCINTINDKVETKRYKQNIIDIWKDKHDDILSYEFNTTDHIFVRSLVFSLGITPFLDLEHIAYATIYYGCMSVILQNNEQEISKEVETCINMINEYGENIKI